MTSHSSVGNPELRIVGGHLALDLVNTVAPRRPGSTAGHEYLGTADALLAWARRVHVLDATEAAAVEAAWNAAPSAAAQALHAVHEIREATYQVLADPGDPTATAVALDHLTTRWAAAAARSSLVLDRGRHGPSGPAAPRSAVALHPTSGTLSPRATGVAQLLVGTNPAVLIPDRLAHHAVELLRTVDLGHLKACPVDEGGCGFLFLDLSRNSSRRWCSMADCGSVAKARRLTERRRARATTKSS